MTTNRLDDVAATLTAAHPDLTARSIGPDGHILNIGAKGRDLTRADVDAARELLTSAGFIEAESWIATEGASWLTDGIKSVSLRVEPAPR